MSPADRCLTLQHAGELLFGKRWREPLARMLEVTGKTIHRWVAGEYVVPLGAIDRLACVLYCQSEQKQKEADELARFSSEIEAELICSMEPRKEAA